MTLPLLPTIVLVTLLGTSAQAGDDCDVAIDTWQPREAVRAMAADQGWRIIRIKIEDGCYEVYGFDRRGQRFEAKIDPQTLLIVELEGEEHDDDD